MEIVTHDILTSEDIEAVQVALTKDAPGFARRIAPVYEILGWTWSDLNAPFIPDEAAILEVLSILISMMSRDVGKQNAGGTTGGLSVWASTEDQVGACAYGMDMTIQTKYKERKEITRRAHTMAIQH